MVNIKTYRDDCQHLRLDAGETAFFARQLEIVKAQVRPVIYNELAAFRLFPMTSEGGAAATTIVWRQTDQAGRARIIASYADDLPKVAVTAAENRTPVRSIGASYGWSLQEIRAAMQTGLALETRLASAAMRAHNELMNSIAWNGDAEHNLPGIKTDSNIPSSAATTGNWAAATADQIIADINEMLNAIVTATNGADSANTVVMPPESMAFLNSKARSTTSDTSVLSFVRQAWPGVTFESAVELKDWSGSDDAMIAYRRDSDHLSMEVPQPYEEMPVERHALRFEVATHSRYAGLLVYYPKAMAIRTGI